MIRAYCNLAGYDDARFDASPWFETATQGEIRRLVVEEWGGLPAGMIALKLSTDAGYRRLAAIIDRRRTEPLDGRGKPILMETHIDPEDAIAWLAEHRPGILGELRNEFGTGLAQSERTKDQWADPTDPDGANYLRRTGRTIVDRDDFEPTVEIDWSEESRCWVATDRTFPGISGRSTDFRESYLNLKAARARSAGDAADAGDGRDPAPAPGR